MPDIFFRESRRSSETQEKGPEEKKKRHRYHWPRESGRVDALDVSDRGAKVIQLGPKRSTPCFSGIHNPAPPNTHRSRRTPHKTEHWAKVSPVGLLLPETRSNDVIPQAVQPQQSPPWQGNIQRPYLTQPMGALPIVLDLARMVADMVQHYMRQQHPQWHALRAEQDMSRRAFAVGSMGDTVVHKTFGHVDRTCHRRRTKWQCFRLGFINMHGARREQKWGELYNALRDEEFSLYAVAETHLRDLEEPPIQPDWHCTGQNRSGQSRKGGGVGVLWRHDLHWQRLDGECRDHMWVTGNVLGVNTAARLRTLLS
ncbi:hypothetical protein MRX96_054149 [Rhipicephalus microplus]